MQRRLDIQHQFATALDEEPFESGQVASTCLVLVIGSSLAVVDPLLEKVAERRRLERGAIIVWQARADLELMEDEPPSLTVTAGYPSPGPGKPSTSGDPSTLGQPSLAPISGALTELTDRAKLEPGGRYYVPAHRRLWFEGTRVRVAARSRNDHRPIDRLLLTLAEGWGNQSASAIGTPLEEDGECGLRIVRAVGGLAMHWPVPSRAKALAFDGSLIGSKQIPRRKSRPNRHRAAALERHFA